MNDFERPTACHHRSRALTWATDRTTVLIVLAGRHDTASIDVVRHLREGGPRACLRVATAIGPARIVLDPRLPRWVSHE